MFFFTNFVFKNLRSMARRLRTLFILQLLLCLLPVGVNAQKKSPQSKAAIYTSLPSGYTRVGTTQLYQRTTSSAIDIIGAFGSSYYSSTFADAGYRVAMKVGSYSAVNVNCLNGTTNNGVRFSASIEQQETLARIVYTLTNTRSTDVTVSLGIHADVMIGSNDRAPISRRKDSAGNTYGLTMKHGNGAQLCALFGSGLVGVTGVSDYWFGYYTNNNSAAAMVGQYTSGSNYMVENGSYDSGMGWCWKSQQLPAGSTATFSWLIGVGEVDLEPKSDFTVTPVSLDDWNDLSKTHRLTVSGVYQSPAGQQGLIEYAVEDSNVWTALTGTLRSGDAFTNTLTAMFTPGRSTHIIKFRTRDQVGNTRLLPTLEYLDVSYQTVGGITAATYSGAPIVQRALTCSLPEGQYVFTAYKNNVNAGTATFNIEGVFPYTIGRKTYEYKIAPKPLAGQVAVTAQNIAYNGTALTPAWRFTDAAFAKLVAGQDYEATWTDNLLPGVATLTVSGIKNYTGTLTCQFEIAKAPLTADLYTLTIPEAELIEDGQTHGATVTVADGVGPAVIRYASNASAAPSETAPASAGTYSVYLQIGEGTLYKGMASTLMGTFTIYRLDEDDWQAIQNLALQLPLAGSQQTWDVSGGKGSVSTLYGLTLDRGLVTGLDFSACSISGDLSAAISRFSHLKTLNLSGNKIGELSTPLPKSIETLDLSGQTIAEPVVLPLEGLSDGSLADHLPTILRYNHSAQDFTGAVTLLLTAADDVKLRLVSSGGKVWLEAASTPCVYRGARGDIVSCDVTSSSAANGSKLNVTLAFRDGDANFDGQVTTADAEAAAQYVFGDYVGKPFNLTAADLWKDGVINVKDVVRIVSRTTSAQ
jgi:hypothetical protein